jgi:hypothetical protein
VGQRWILDRGTSALMHLDTGGSLVALSEDWDTPVVVASPSPATQHLHLGWVAEWGLAKVERGGVPRCFSDGDLGPRGERVGGQGEGEVVRLVKRVDGVAAVVKVGRCICQNDSMDVIIISWWACSEI